MSTKQSSFVLVALLAALLPNVALAQHPMPPAAPGAPGAPGGVDPRMQAMMAAQMRIMQAQQQAIADPAIVKERDVVQKAIETEMTKRDKKVRSKLDRFHALEKQIEGMQAQDTKDPAKLEPLLKEIRELAMELSQHQQKVMEDPAVMAKVDAFEKKLLAKMGEIDPGVPALIEQMKAAQASAPPH